MALSAAALGVAGCSDDNTASSTNDGSEQQAVARLTKADFIAKADDICRDLNKVTRPYEHELTALSTKTSRLAGVYPILRDGIVETRKGLLRLGALREPREDRATVFTYLNSIENALFHATAIAEAAKAKNAGRVKELVATNPDVNGAHKRLARQYGFKVCD